MIINWKKPKAGVKVIPLLSDDGRIEKNIMFLPGYNEVSEADWNKARKHEQVQDYIKRGFFEEVGTVKEEVVEVPVMDKKGKEVKDEAGKVKTEKKKVEVIEEVKLSELDAEKALSIVNDTYMIDTLEAWRKEEGRDEIRAAIANQIEKINKEGQK